VKPKTPPKHKISCLDCGNQQMEYVVAEATFCHACGARIELAAGKTRERKKRAAVERRDVACYQCGGALRVPLSAMSWQCNQCSTYLDFRDYLIDRPSGSSIQTYGTLEIAPSGQYAGSRAEVESVRVAGSSVGQIISRGSVTINGRARLHGGAQGSHLHVEPDCMLISDKPLFFKTATIAGRLDVSFARFEEHLQILEGGSIHAQVLLADEVSAEKGASIRARLVTVKAAAQGALGLPQELLADMPPSSSS
jgi:hypothetical protein